MNVLHSAPFGNGEKKCGATFVGVGAETSHEGETDGLEMTESKSQKIDHIQQNGRSG